MRACVARATVNPAYAVARHTSSTARRTTRQARNYASLVNVDTTPHELPPLTPKPTSRKLSSSRLDNAQTLTHLHNVRGLLPRVLAPDSPELAFWNGCLDGVAEELSRAGAEDGVLSVVVYSVDEQAGGDAVVQALLEDPFSSEADLKRVRERWSGRDGASRIDIRNGPPPTPSTSTSPPEVYLHSNFFASSPSPLSLTELRPTSHQPSPSTLQTLYSADIPIIVLNPLTTPLPSLSHSTDPSLSSGKLFPFTLPPHALVLIASASPSSSPSSARERLSQTLALPPSQILFIDPTRAQSASSTLSSSTPTALSVQRYHDDSLGSGLSALRQTLAGIMVDGRARSRKAEGLVRAALGTSKEELGRAEREVEVAMRTAAELGRLVSAARASADSLVLGTPGAGRDTIHTALQAADEIIRPTINALWPQPLPAVSLKPGENKVVGYARRWTGFWKGLLPRLKLSTLGNADDVAWIVGRAVREGWTGGIERTLLPAYSPLSPLQARLTSSTLSLLATLPPALRSSLLLNTLHQLSSSPSYPIIPSTLLHPLSVRLKRLNEGPTAALGRSAQALAARVAGSAVGGVGVAGGSLVWTHGADVLLGSSLTELSLSNDIGTAVGAGLLVTVAGIRWSLSKWDRARRAWLADWDRMREGAERELKVEYGRVLEGQVLGVVREAKEGVVEGVQRRGGEVRVLRGEVERVEEGLSKTTRIQSV